MDRRHGARGGLCHFTGGAREIVVAAIRALLRGGGARGDSGRRLGESSQERDDEGDDGAGHCVYVGPACRRKGVAEDVVRRDVIYDLSSSLAYELDKVIG